MANATISLTAPGVVGGQIYMGPGDLVVDVVSSDSQQ
jgi:hypothetical protein